MSSQARIAQVASSSGGTELTKCAGLMSVAICAAVLFVATPQQDDVQLLNKMEKVRMIKGLKVCRRSNISRVRALAHMQSVCCAALAC